MKNSCSDTPLGKFFQSVSGEEFETFKRKIKSLSFKNNIIFNEDVFMETIVRCMVTFSKENATRSDIEHYFWRAFKQNSFSYFSRNKFKNSVKFEVYHETKPDTEYNTDIDDIVDLLKDEVEKEFGSEIFNAWILHICYDYTYAELEKRGYEGLNLHNEFKQIKRFINNKLIKKKPDLKRLLTDNNLL